MPYSRISRLSRSVAVGCALFIAVPLIHAEEKSMWTKFVEFFSPSSSVEGEGPLYDELRELDRKINRVEGKYARERRPMNKDRYKKELAQLKQERETLLKKIEAEEKNKGMSSSVVALSSSAVAKSSSSLAISSSTIAAPSSGADAVETDFVAVAVCKPDTVFVRDTVVIHDTLFVMLAPKPEAVPADSSKKQ